MAISPFEPHAPTPEWRTRDERRNGALPHATDATIARELEAGATSEMRLAFAVDRLRELDPDASAATRLGRWQAMAIALACALIAAGLWSDPRGAVALVFLLGAVPALAYLVLRLAAIREIIGGGGPEWPPACVPRDELPGYSVLVPLYREAPVVGQLLAALEALDYPRDRLDILLIVEADDCSTRAAIAQQVLAPHIRVVVVPCGQPRTKPRALNYALTFAHGAFVAVFDAEDQPEPDQLLKAVAAFRRCDDKTGCLQACLNTYNPAQSWLTRQFTLEYTALFDGILPALERHGLPVMLGGTSNHFPRAVLDDVLAWDPFNVTEDADLGLRLARRGYHVGMLQSTTWEEAPPTYAVWLGQRTRWLKGWMQTYLVHMRRPRRLWRELGPGRFGAFNLITGGAVLSALVHPWIYAAILLDIVAGPGAGAPAGLLDALLWWSAWFNLAASYSAAILLAAVAARARGRSWLGPSSLWLPVYWLAISRAAYRSLAELVLAPHHWEKTAHSGRGNGVHSERDSG